MFNLDSWNQMIWYNANSNNVCVVMVVAISSCPFSYTSPENYTEYRCSNCMAQMICSASSESSVSLCTAVILLFTLSNLSANAFFKQARWVGGAMPHCLVHPSHMDSLSTSNPPTCSYSRYHNTPSLNHHIAMYTHHVHTRACIHVHMYTSIYIP